jgi:hypothetical protein
MNAASIPYLLLPTLALAAAEHHYGANEAGDITVVAATSKVSIVAQHRIEGLCPATLTATDGTLAFRTAETLLALGRP